MHEMIEVTALHKAFRGQRVLRNVDLRVPRGAVVGLIGNNGSGKSVLLKCICGLMVPDAGEVRVGGKRVGKEVDFPPNVGALIEAPGFLPRESGYNNMYYLWSIRKQVDQSNIEKKMSLVGLSSKDRKPVGKYSLGMRQRLGIAQALLEDPEVLILDEPFNCLDKHGRTEMYAVLKGLHDEGQTMIISSHHSVDIDELCEAVYEIDAGEVRLIRHGVSGK